MSATRASLAGERFPEWLAYTQRLLEAADSGKSIPLGPSPVLSSPPGFPTPEARAGKVVFCAAHPDDESLSGALALRLRLEEGVRVTNIAVTLGSDPAQRDRRRRELESACRVLGFDLVIPRVLSASVPAGFDRVTLAAREADPGGWAESVRTLAGIFDREQPEAVFTPHANDFNSTHIGTHQLVLDALDVHLSHRQGTSLILIETEYWHELAEPNLMVGVTPETVAIQLTAAAEHGGEMARAPFHLLHPCRLLDNARRGSEVIGGQGRAVQPFAFAELYRVGFRRGSEVILPRPGGHILSPLELVTLHGLRRQFWPAT
jgi:LmbE family N-acetylglucosaminyl deacetylase